MTFHSDRGFSMLIDSLTKKTFPSNVSRETLRCSSLGHKCNRYLYYMFNGESRPDITFRQQSIFKLGFLLEDFLLSNLGLSLSDEYELILNLERRADDELSIIKGTPDALVMKHGVKHGIIDIKSCNDASFKTFQRKGLKEWSETYYAQLQIYMSMYDVKNGYLIAINKNTCELHEEHILRDDMYIETLRGKAHYISKLEQEPERLNDNPAFYICKMCDYRKKCHDLGGG